MRLIDAPVGLFLYKKTLCVKTEYIADWGVEAYIVSSGEILWGDAHTAEERNALEVIPVTIDPESLRPQGEWSECDWVEYDGHGECIHHPKAGLRCSNCCNAFKKELLWKDNYCPNCGTKMRIRR